MSQPKSTKGKKKPSAMMQLPSTSSTGFMAQSPWPGPWNPWMSQSVPGSPMVPMTQARQGGTSLRKPWEDDDDDDDDEEEDDDSDFQPKKRRLAQAKSATDPKRRPGRPRKDAASASQHNQAVLVSKYPKPFEAFLQQAECLKCHIYVGKVILKPCGHARYCFRCVNDLRHESVRLNRPAKCLSSSCYELVKSWLTMYNVSA